SNLIHRADRQTNSKYVRFKYTPTPPNFNLDIPSSLSVFILQFFLLVPFPLVSFPLVHCPLVSFPLFLLRPFHFSFSFYSSLRVTKVVARSVHPQSSYRIG